MNQITVNRIPVLISKVSHTTGLLILRREDDLQVKQSWQLYLDQVGKRSQSATLLPLTHNSFRINPAITKSNKHHLQFKLHLNLPQFIALHNNVYYKKFSCRGRCRHYQTVHSLRQTEDVH